MAISQEVKTVVKKTTYVCDMLFKEIEEHEVHAKYGNHCISKEAVNRLPEDVRNNKVILKYVLYGSGQESAGFQPEMLHKGIWVVEVPTYEYGFVSKLVNNNDLDTHFGDNLFCKDDHADRLKTYEDAMNWIKSRCDQFGDSEFRYWIFNNGKLIKSLKTQTVPVEVEQHEEEEDDE